MIIRERKTNAIPVRFDVATQKVLEDLSEKTDLSRAELIRRASRYAFPKFLSREVDILDVPPSSPDA